jgi:flagellar hook-basal body complex protein FliE
MSIEAIASVVTETPRALGVQTLTEVLPQTRVLEQGAPDFTQWMAQYIGEVNGRIIDAQTGLQQLATGETGNLHQVMLQIEEAKLAFQITAQIRNKVLEGYQEIMRMQI